MMKKLVVAAAMAAASVAAKAAYVRGELIWKCDFTRPEAEAHGLASHKLASNGTGVEFAPNEGISGDGAMRFVSRSQQSRALITIEPELDIEGMVLVEADVKGVEVGEGVHAWNGPKVMMPYVPANKNGKTSYPQTPSETGSFDWKTWTMVMDFGKPESPPKVVLGLECAVGELLVDSVRVYRAKEIPDEDVVAPVNEAAKKIRRGEFAAGHNPKALRGVMSGGDLSEESIANLAGWGANLMRLQIGGKGLRNAESMPDYFAALSNKLDWCVEVMDRCAKQGIKVVVDLHAGPACVSSKQASNLIPADYDPRKLVQAWELIASRLKDHPATYAYDILNEPSVAPDTWPRVCLDVMQAVRKLDAKTPFVVETCRHWYEGEKVIYSPHFYSPHAITHTSVSTPTKVRWSYPGYINGVYWDKEQMRVELKPWIEFQAAHPGAEILVGEFSCILWARGADKWIRDAIDIFEEYGWSWCYHAYREWPPWDVEYTYVGDYEHRKWIKATTDTDRKKELVKGLSYNGRPPAVAVTVAKAADTTVAKAADRLPRQAVPKVSFTMRLDDNRPASWWRDIAAIFERHGYRCSFAVNAALLDERQGACLRELAGRGHEIMDHTPCHRLFEAVYPDETSFERARKLPFALDSDPATRTVFFGCDVDEADPKNVTFRARIVDGELILAGKHAGRKPPAAFFRIPGREGVFGYKKEADRFMVRDFWGHAPKEPIQVDECDMLGYANGALQPCDDLLRELASVTRERFDHFGIPRPKVWIFPGGWCGPVRQDAIERVYGGEFGYIGADAQIGPAKRGEGRWYAAYDKMEFFDAYSPPKTPEAFADAVEAKIKAGKCQVTLSHMQTRDIKSFLEKTERFAAELEKRGIPVTTMSESIEARFGDAAQ